MALAPRQTWPLQRGALKGAPLSLVPPRAEPAPLARLAGRGKHRKALPGACRCLPATTAPRTGMRQMSIAAGGVRDARPGITAASTAIA